ncbi:molybdenum ABC transporter permease [Chryseobacterium sp.]|uniref:molybdenum ABC transporter permease n=1 Tax=Chryseobacterium sp. TaxID=1871047 RepID=UPI00289F49E9|nr:molybdenum ABC transporter permease [Chryseobacterium sp.]
MDKLIISIVFLLLGFALRYWINRRKFNRRGVAGLEGFSSYEKATAVRFLERIGKIVSIFLILIGILFLYGYYRNKSHNANNENKVELGK